MIIKAEVNGVMMPFPSEEALANYQIHMLKKEAKSESNPRVKKMRRRKDVLEFHFKRVKNCPAAWNHIKKIYDAAPTTTNNVALSMGVTVLKFSKCNGEQFEDVKVMEKKGVSV